MSVALQMVTNGGDTEGLFRGAFMQSGTAIPSGDISLGQQDYDDLVREARCAEAEDTLECLRQVPFAVLKAAMNMSPTTQSYRVCQGSLHSLSTITNPILQSMNLAWIPRADGTFLEAPPQQLVLQGSVAKIPFVTGDKNPKVLCFRVDQPIWLLQAAARMREPCFPYPASTLRE